MRTGALITQIGAFFGYALLQVFFLDGAVLFGYAFCWVYVSFLLFLPFNTDRILLLFLAFFFGLFVDVFYDTLGVNIAACLTLAYTRKWVLELFSPSGGYEPQQRPLLTDMRLSWFASYTLTLLFVHHLVLFSVEVASIQQIGTILLKTVSSVAFTFITILLFQYLFYQKTS